MPELMCKSLFHSVRMALLPCWSQIDNGDSVPLAVGRGRIYGRTSGIGVSIVKGLSRIAGASASPEYPRRLSGGRNWLNPRHGQRSRQTGVSPSQRAGERCPPAASHVLLPSGDAWCSRASHSGAGRTSGLDHHSTVHALESGSSRKCNPLAGTWGEPGLEK